MPDPRKGIKSPIVFSDNFFDRQMKILLKTSNFVLCHVMTTTVVTTWKTDTKYTPVCRNYNPIFMCIPEI